MAQAIDASQYNFAFSTPEDGLFCGHCLKSMAELKKDKKGRPYLWCPYCRSRSFLGSDVALTGVRTMSREVIRRMGAMLQGEQSTPSEHIEQAGMEATG